MAVRNSLDGSSKEKFFVFGLGLPVCVCVYIHISLDIDHLKPKNVAVTSLDPYAGHHLKLIEIMGV